MLAASLLLGGLLPLGPNGRARWAPSGAWRMPVGDPYALLLERPARPGPFFLLRGVERDGGRATHQGADIGSGRAGSLVRAAASGLVVRAADHGEHGGYGTHVVLAHRLPGGGIAYSVYAHLRLASIRVRAGQFVTAGTALGRVGMTGRATTPHLHFEVRTASAPGERWEFAAVEDPLAFVAERLPSHRGDTSGVAAYLEWAEFAGLLPPGAGGDEALTHEAWWRMLATATRGVWLDPGSPPEALGDSLRAEGLLARTRTRPAPGGGVEWPEIAHDLARVRRAGVRIGTAPFRRARHRRVCEAQLAAESPARQASALSGRPGRPSLADAVVLLADVAGPRPEPPPARRARTPIAARADSSAPGRRAATGDSLRRGASAARREAGGGASRTDSLAQPSAPGADAPRRAPRRSPRPVRPPTPAAADSGS